MDSIIAGVAQAMFNLIGAIISGLFVGALARFFYPGVIDMGWGMTILLGIGGSLLAGLITTRGQYGEGFHRAGCLVSVIGAMVLIFVGRHFGRGM
jgi:uncharacterized membrane protein YeaQ/YmgE (transglycosylase-associated protein family)